MTRAQCRTSCACSHLWLQTGPSVRARLRLGVKRILRKYKYPPDQQDAAVELVQQQAKALGVAWMA